LGADFDSYEMEEESSFSNTKGFFSLTSQLMFSATHAEINNDLHKLHKCLYSLYGWMIANYNPDERTQARNKFNNVINNLQSMNKYNTNNSQKKSIEHYNTAANLLQEIKQELVEKMHDKNLLYPVREKGSALWN
jgi:hypothetical protein